MLLALGFLTLTGLAQAASVDRTLTLQVYRVCDDAGANCASMGPAGDRFFSDETNKIWAQAGISVGFSYMGDIDSTRYSFIDDSTSHGFAELSAAYGTLGPSSSIVDLFLVRTVAGAYGEGWLGAGGLVMAMDTVMSFNGGLGRIDTIAHELGHNLGLDHSTPGNNYLMTSGLSRLIPTTVGDIAPDGLALDLLSPAMINTVRDSSLLTTVPEPFSLTLAAAGLLVIGLARHRRA